jgi:hypothetical protein
MQYNKDMKTYKPIPEWEAYSISKCGEVIRMQSAKGAKIYRVLKQQKHKTRPYLMVRLHCNGKSKTFDIHRLVALTYLGEIPKHLNVCHLNGNPKDNRVENLRIDTRQSNEKDKVLHGTSNRGAKNGMNKHDEQTIVAIKHLLKNGKSCNEISKIYEIPSSQIRNIKNGYKWSWLTI